MGNQLLLYSKGSPIVDTSYTLRQWNSEIRPLLANWQFSFWQLQLNNQSSIALHNYTPNLVYCYTVHTNVIVVTISIGDLIAGVGAATKNVCPGQQTPSCHHFAQSWVLISRQSACMASVTHPAVGCHHFLPGPHVTLPAAQHHRP